MKKKNKNQTQLFLSDCLKCGTAYNSKKSRTVKYTMLDTLQHIDVFSTSFVFQYFCESM